MKKILLAVVAAFSLCAAPAFAVEWGGLINNESKVTKTSDFAFHQANAVYLWANAPLGKAFSFAAEGMYKFSFDTPGNTIGNVADVDLFKLGGNIDFGSGKFILNAGRFTVADNTGVNFSQCCDGLAASILLSKVNLSFYAGYTGLLNSLNVSILGAQSESRSFYSLCHGYVPVLAAVEFPSLFANQAIALQGEAFIDIDKETKYNRIYANFTMGGPIAGTVYYSLISSVGLVEKDIMNYSSLSIAAYPNDSIALNIGASFASGDFGGKGLKPYATFTSRPAYGSASSPETTGCIVPNVDFIYTVGNMFANVNVKAPLAMPEKKPSFAGVGADLAFIYNIFSDLQAEVDASYFKDVAGKGADDNLSAALKFVISF